MRKLVSIVLAFAFVLSPLLARAADPPRWVMMSRQEARERELVKAKRLEHAGIALAVLGAIAFNASIVSVVFTVLGDYPCNGACQGAYDASIGLGAVSIATIGAGVPMWSVGAARARRLERVTVQPTASGVIVHF